MDPKLRILLKKIGFSEKEVLAYLSLLRLGGSQPVNLIAQKSGLNRSTTYHTLSSLVHRGMVSTFLKEKIQHYSALAPQYLLEIFQRRERFLHRHIEELQSALPLFDEYMSTSSASSGPNIRLLEGEDSFRFVFERAFEAKEFVLFRPLSSILSTSFAPMVMGQIQNFSLSRIPYRILLESCDASHEYFQNLYPRPDADHFSFLPPDFSLSSREILVFGKSVCFLSFSQKHLSTLLLEDEGISTIQRSLFDFFWNGSKKSVF
ncbi:MAG: helix-turn-helix domain-containing protein [Patescibacteria group bacterium]